MSDTIIVTRHRGAIDWLARQNIKAPIKHFVTERDVKNKTIIGTLPIKLAAKTKNYIMIEFPNFPHEWDGKELSADDMEAIGARLRCYKVSEVPVYQANL